MTASSPLLIGLAICFLQGIQGNEWSKPGVCPAQPTMVGKARFCRNDKDCVGSQKCCLTKVGRECTEPAQAPKPIAKKGSCPPKPNGPVGLANFCQNDYDCDGSKKCCLTNIGYDCKAPVEESGKVEKPGECPVAMAPTGYTPIYYCQSDNDCDGPKKCCFTSKGKECVKPKEEQRPIAKKGTCPPKPNGPVGLANFCQNDYDCDGSKKCCLTNIGYDCKAPVEESGKVEKPGECPVAMAPTGYTPIYYCQSDNDCDGPKKCCFTSKGKECVKPKEEQKPIAKKGTCPPKPNGPVGLANFCQNDYDCDGSKKCCLTNIGYDCKAPVEESGKVEKPGECPMAMAPTGYTPIYYCQSDNDCDGPKKCCFTSKGKECVKPKEEQRPIAKKGTCPPKPNGPVGLANFCQNDYDCDGSKKCCLTNIGYDCKAPVEESGKVEKPGECPVAMAPTGYTPIYYCQSDNDCDGPKKCCFTSKGKECVKPKEEQRPIAKKGTCPPKPNGPVGLANFCQNDYDCDGSKKCCLTNIGYDCKAPVEESGKVEKPGECPVAMAPTGYTPIYYCQSDNDCDGPKKCCFTSKGKECVKPKEEQRPIAKKGTCPPKPNGPVGLANFCQNDYDCDGSKKCCLTNIGYDCKAPVEESGKVEKPGECPVAMAPTGYTPIYYCQSDNDCDGPKKCCFTSKGKECVKPKEEPRPIAKKGSCPPQPIGPVGLANFCQNDYDCDGSKKCCLTNIGYDCKAPVEESEKVEKPGECPVAVALKGYTQIFYCQSDNDCDGPKKCCFTSKGKECVKPKEEQRPIAKKGTCPPKPNGPVGLANFCQNDYDCDGSKKCCLTNIGYDCKAPVEESGKVEKPGECPVAMAPTGYTPIYYCQSDNDCDGPKKCCFTSKGKECVKPKEEQRPIAKKGTCPPKPNGPVGLANFCQNDYDCDGSKKCCLTNIGYDCKAPVEESGKVEKPGECPVAMAPSGYTPIFYCQSDNDCDGPKKCCFTSKGKECVKPKEEPRPIAKKGSCPPQPIGPVGLANFCQNDYDCDGSKKCCLTNFGYDCKAPVEESDEWNKPGECPAQPSMVGKALFCKNDKDCVGSQKCCLTRVGRECIEPATTPKPIAKKGSCPPKPIGAVGLANFCQTDFDCTGNQKCCITTVGYDCTPPVEEHVKPNKPGICPWPSSVTTPSRLCSDDDDCQGSRKCCPTKAGNACVDPASRQLAGRRPSCPPAAYVMGIPGSCRKDKDCDDGKKCCDGNEGKSCSVTVLPR